MWGVSGEKWGQWPAVGGSGEFTPEPPPGNHHPGTTARERSPRVVAGARSIEHAARQGLRKARRIEEPWNDSSTSPEGEVLLSNR
ncbi:hypothetical protein A3Q41_04305 [Rhodococcoides fascians]|uniref:Uncharacterized protein n=1 Tax=Rhodococcoides fascians TaxID=1828 RepID=A0A143QRJ3_RHOFA|nr:hypothetical protein A3Q41_04305 [Rhodococcus fascians]